MGTDVVSGLVHHKASLENVSPSTPCQRLSQTTSILYRKQQHTLFTKISTNISTSVNEFRNKYVDIIRIALLLCLLCENVSTTTSYGIIECPSQCVCPNVTSTQYGQPSINIIDCSHGGLNSFLALYAHLYPNSNLTENNNINSSGHSPAMDNNITSFELDQLPILSKEINRTLVSLNLSFNNMSTLSILSEINWNTAPICLIQLNVSNNQLQQVENSLHNFSQLVSIDLSHNALQEFAIDSFVNISSLQYLRLQHNQISSITIPTTFHKNSRLVELDLSNNNLTELAAYAFSSFPILSTLNLSHNKISILNRFAFQLPKLQNLFLSANNITALDQPVFQNTSLIQLALDNLPLLTRLHYNTFLGLNKLKKLDLSGNNNLDFLHPTIFSKLDLLQCIDLSGCGMATLSPLTFHNLDELKTVFLDNLPLTCQCTNAWLAKEASKQKSIFSNVSDLVCKNQTNQTTSISDAVFPCQNISIPKHGGKLVVHIGSSITLQCKQGFPSGENVLRWTLPSGHHFYLQSFHANATDHLLAPDNVAPDAHFHTDHVWHQSCSYYADLDSYKDRILLLSDGSLFIDYVLRTDTGQYKCMIYNADFNDTDITVLNLDYQVAGEIEYIALAVGFICAFSFLALNLVYVIITWIARRLINKRRREVIRQMLENLNSYKSTQITRVHENYTSQLNRVRNSYHMQRDRLHRNYTMQVDRVKRGCSHQVVKVRENYNTKLTNLRDYSSSQILQIRELANTQISRIRDYGSSQFDRLRETYKFQQQHLIKLMETMNLDNCKSMVETECMRTESMMYDLDLLSQDDDRSESHFSAGDSEYDTAASTPMLSNLRVELQDPEDSNYQIKQRTSSGTSSNSTNCITDPVGKSSCVHMPDDDTHIDITEPGGMIMSIPDQRRREQRPSNRHSVTADIEMEMNSVLALPDNIRLDAKEVWTYGKGDDTRMLYTKVTGGAQPQPDNNSKHEVHMENTTNDHLYPSTSAPVTTIEVKPVPLVNLDDQQNVNKDDAYVDMSEYTDTLKYEGDAINSEVVFQNKGEEEDYNETDTMI